MQLVDGGWKVRKSNQEQVGGPLREDPLGSNDPKTMLLGVW